MARFTLAYSSFISRLEEVNLLARSALTKERKNPFVLQQEINALCRGALVLLCSHLEAYVRDIGEVALDSLHQKHVPRNILVPRLFYHISKDIFDDIHDITDHDKLASRVFDFIRSDLPYWSPSGPFPDPIAADRFSRGFASPAVKKIAQYFNRFGYTDYKRDMKSQLKGQYDATIALIDHLVDIRNKIAHGDTSVTKTPQELLEMIGLVRVYCATTDSVFSSWFGRSFCTIR